jgi:para-nitrobenzyl esterase
MMKLSRLFALGLFFASTHAVQAAPSAAPRVIVDSGALEGTQAVSGVRVFRGVPFAAPPVGELRWKAPQPLKRWQGVRPAKQFGNRSMQPALFADMVFRSPAASEDCLYLNVWTPAASRKERLPVLVYFHGGGLAAGDSAEPRYDGESMARKGIVAVTVNYRLSVFGFLAHPELTAESPHRVSGNYGLMDQAAALQWVQKNIGAFGGDPSQVTIAGESAGSFSVSAQMIMPSSRGTFARAIGESGSLLGLTPPPSLAEAEKLGVSFARAAGAETLKALRALPAEKLVQTTTQPGMPWFGIVSDGHVLPQTPLQAYGKGQQARVPLLAGWNAQETGAARVLEGSAPTPENFRAAIRKLYGEQAAAAEKAYSYGLPQAAIDLASDRWIVYGTWKWIDLHSRVAPTFRYLYTRPRPTEPGAGHSAEIEYALGNLDRNKVFAWTEDDQRTSAAMQAYFANFIKTGNPNGEGLPAWPLVTAEGDNVMRIDAQPQAVRTSDRERFQFHDRQISAP